MTLLKIWEYHYDSDFAKGVQLLIDHEGQKYLTALAFQRLQVLAISGKPVDPYNLGKLTGALQKITLEDTVTLETGTEPKPGKKVWMAPVIESASTETPVTSPLAKRLHKEQAHHHALMGTAATDKERGEHAGEILRISGELDAEYDRLRAEGNPVSEEEAGPAPAAKREPIANQVRRLHSLRTRIAKLKNHLIPKASAKRLADLEKELEKKQAEVKTLEHDLA